MIINGVTIEDTFAEAFPMWGTRLLITAETARWADVAAREATGYSTSVISCDAEAGIERTLDVEETPDGRPGVSILMFAFNRDKLAKAAANRVGQCVMTCATTACYDGLTSAEHRIRLGADLRFFGDGDQFSKRLDPSDLVYAGTMESPAAGTAGTAGTAANRPVRLWRVPVMDGEFVCEDKIGAVKGVAGGNFLILGRTSSSALRAAESAVDAIALLSDVIAPFPGGVVRSGSKVGSKYRALPASTNDAFCPTLRRPGGKPAGGSLPDGVNAVYEIVLDGLSLEAVVQATVVGIRAACQDQDGVLGITAGNYGGNLGPHHIKLHEILQGSN